MSALICQLLGLTVALLMVRFNPQWVSGIWQAAFVQAASAALFSYILRQPFWWLIIHSVFFPVVLFSITLNLPSSLYLGASLLLLLVFWGTAKGDVPLFLSTHAVSEAIEAIVRREMALKFADLGAGIGSVVIPLAQNLPDLKINALERAPLPWLFTRWRSRKYNNIDVTFKSLWDCKLGVYDVVFVFLSPLVMKEIGEKAISEMRPESLFISSSFPIPGWMTEFTVTVNDSRETILYCYRIQPKDSSSIQ